MLFLHVTTHIEDRKDEDLFGKKGGTGFPTFMFLDPKGGVLAKRPGALGVPQMTELHDGAKKRHDAFVELQKKAMEGDEKAKVKLAVWELELTHTTLADFRKKYPDFSKLDEDLRETVMGIWGDETMQKAGAAFSKVVGRDRSKMPEGAKVAAPIIFEAAKQGAEPSDERNRRSYYWILGMGGDALGNAEMLKLAIKALEDDAESIPQLGNLVQGWMTKLKALEGGKEKVEEDDGDEPDDEGMPEDDDEDEDGDE